MPVTFWTFIIGTLALSGIPPFSGFYSKDSILAQALGQENYLLFGVAVFVAVLTTFYMFRLFFVAFLGEARTEKARHAHESPAVMTLPLVVLAVFAVIGGFIGIAGHYGSQFGMGAEKLSVAQQGAGAAEYTVSDALRPWRGGCRPDRRVCVLPAGRDRSAAGPARLAFPRDAEPLLFRRTLRGHVHPRARFHRGGGGLD
jgi:hypothetical protein